MGAGCAPSPKPQDPPSARLLLGGLPSDEPLAALVVLRVSGERSPGWAACWGGQDGVPDEVPFWLRWSLDAGVGRSGGVFQGTRRGCRK